MQRYSSVFLAFAGLLAASCSFEPLDLTGRRCGCGPGWVCDPETNRCVQPGDPVDGGSDSGGDAGREIDTGTADAGVDTGSSDSTGDASRDAFEDTTDPTLCERHDSALVCDDFETPGFPGWRFPGAMVTQSSDTVHTGTGALRAENTSGGGVSAVARDFAEPIGSGVFHIRMWVQVPVSGFAGIFNMTDSRLYTGFGLAVSDGRILGTRFGDTGIEIPTANPVDPGTWNCVALRVEVADAGTIELSVNNGPTARRAPVDTLPSGGLTQANVGITFTRPASADQVVYVDDLVIGTAPLSCPE